ncbi:MAG: ClpXP protease specificity-enhancing factor [Orrella sp.]|uniref:ClpXP protease specificity-enhancing factor n=1 Tax=Orrella sp. TaxID=1921583 RepID=UPI003BDB8CFE
MVETATKPYFIRALHEWCTDNGLTPHLVVQVDENTRVPMSFVQDGQITLSVSYAATQQLKIGNEFVEFQARFGGKTEMIWVPIGAVSAIYAKETGTGMGFEVQPVEQTQSLEAKTIAQPAAAEEVPQRPHLKIVK